MVALPIERNFSDTAEVAFLFAPRLTHDRVERLTPRQQAEALHEFVEYRDAVKRHVFNPDKNPHTRILALGTLIDQAEKTCAKHKAISEPQPFWIGCPEQEGSFAARIGLGQNFISREHKAYEQAGLIDRPHRRTDNGNDHIDLAVLPALMTETDLLPSKGERPRKPPVLCKSCGSEVLVKEVRTQVVCACCGTIHSEHKSQTMVNAPEEETPIITREVTIGEEDIVTREVIIETDTIVTREVIIGQEEEADSPPKTPARDSRQIFEEAAALLVEIAGDEPMHAEMNQSGKKYGPVRRAFGLDDARAHLSGKSARAARIRRADGNTRALVFDADSAAEWGELQLAAHLLRAAGYVVLMEDSPTPGDHAGGGHMWIIYDGLVDARAAYRHVCEIAPMLASVKEYWPQKKQPIRLPGGKYVTPNFSAQCKLYDAIGGLVAETRAEAAAALLAYQTPSAIVPDYPPDPEPEPKKPAPRRATIQPAAPGRGAEISFTAGQLAAWFNERNRCEDILPPVEHGALPRAFPTWREHGNKPNVVFYSKTNTWCDFGDGQRGGDALDLYILASGRDKKDVLSELGREYRAELIGKNHQIVSCTDRPAAIKDEARDEGTGGVSALETVDFSHLPEEIQTLCQQYALTPAEPCSTCGCPLHNRLDECARCWPVKSKPGNIAYADYGSEIIDRVYPRNHTVQSIQFGGKSHAA